jgi:hypothetical protein
VSVAALQLIVITFSSGLYVIQELEGAEEEEEEEVVAEVSFSV